MGKKTAFVLIFAMVVLLSIHTVLGDDNFMENAKDRITDAASAAKGAAEGLSESTSDAFKEARETTSTWTDWFNGKLKDMGIKDDDRDDTGHAKAPESE